MKKLLVVLLTVVALSLTILPAAAQTTTDSLNLVKSWLSVAEQCKIKVTAIDRLMAPGDTLLVLLPVVTKGPNQGSFGAAMKIKLTTTQKDYFTAQRISFENLYSSACDSITKYTPK